MTGVKPLSILHLLFVLCCYWQGKSQSSQALLKRILERSSAPFMEFIREWIFHGEIRDPFDEFMIGIDQDYYMYLFLPFSSPVLGFPSWLFVSFPGKRQNGVGFGDTQSRTGALSRTFLSRRLSWFSASASPFGSSLPSTRICRRVFGVSLGYFCQPPKRKRASSCDLTRGCLQT